MCNKIELENEKSIFKPQMGDLFIDEKNSEFYILAFIDTSKGYELYSLINLTSGNRYKQPATIDKVFSDNMTGFRKLQSGTKLNVIVK